MSEKLEMGTIICTPSVVGRLHQDKNFRDFVFASADRCRLGDWGDTCEEDRIENDQAIVDGERIVAVYKYPADDTELWIVTESDRSATTILFPHEY